MANFYLQWHITDRCPNNCKHCYIGKRTKQEPDLATTDRLIKDLQEMSSALGCGIDIAITGGDPFLHPRFWEIVAKVRKVVDFLAILGNPEEINSYSISKLAEAGVDWCNISVDGFMETHDSIRRTGSFKESIRALKLLVKSSLHVGVHTTVSSWNIKELPDLMDYLYGLGIDRWAFSRYVPTDGKSLDITPEEYYEFMHAIKERHAKWEQRLGATRQGKDPLWATVYNDYPVNSDVIDGGCILGSMALTLLPDNTVMGCRRHEGSVLEKWEEGKSLLEIWVDNPRLNEIREIKKIEYCNQCKYLCSCRGCRAVAWATSQSLYGKDPQCILASLMEKEVRV